MRRWRNRDVRRVTRISGSARVSRVESSVAPKQIFPEIGKVVRIEVQRKSAIARTRSPARGTRALPGTWQITLDDCNSSLSYKGIGGRDNEFVHRVGLITEQTRRANSKRQMDVIQARCV